MAKRKDWTPEENTALVALYQSMLAAVRKGSKYNKASMIRTAQAGALSERSRGSIEAKLMNLTAVYQDLDMPSMAEHGYKPAPNYQKALRQAAVDAHNAAVIEKRGRQALSNVLQHVRDIHGIDLGA